MPTRPFRRLAERRSLGRSRYTRFGKSFSVALYGEATQRAAVSRFDSEIVGRGSADRKRIGAHLGERRLDNTIRWRRNGDETFLLASCKCLDYVGKLLP